MSTLIHKQYSGGIHKQRRYGNKGRKTLSMVQMKYGCGFPYNTIHEQIFMLQFEKYEFL
jgi:hypothetical protein